MDGAFDICPSISGLAAKKRGGTEAMRKPGMKRISFKSLILAGSAALALMAAPAARAETLADALIAAYRNSNLLEQNRATLRAADEDVATAIASLRPVLRWVADATYTKSAYAEYYTVQSGGEIDRLSASLGLSASMVLFDFGQSKLGVDIAKESVLATREALVGVEQDVLLSAVAAYTGVKSASERVSINQNSVRVIGEELRAAQDRFEVGEVTRTDVSLAEARLAAARASLAAAQGELLAARESYKDGHRRLSEGAVGAAFRAETCPSRWTKPVPRRNVCTRPSNSHSVW